MRVAIAGQAALGPAPEVPLSLDELIYRVVAGALEDSGLEVGDIDGVCMSASDLNDGRAISTMTLTGSTGSLGKSEMRVCNDGLAALMMGAAEVGSGAAERLIVCGWSKLSDADPSAISPLRMEPVFHRDLNFHPGAIVAMRESADSGRPQVLAPSESEPVDVAIAMVIGDTGLEDAPVLTGFGASMSSYLRPGAPLLQPLATAAHQALEKAGRELEELSSVVVAGLPSIEDERLEEALGVPAQKLRRPRGDGADLGYAAGLAGVHLLLEEAEPGISLVVSAAGIGLENTFAATLEIR